MRRAVGLAALALIASLSATESPARTAEPKPLALLPIAAVDSAGFTVSNMERALDFYTRVLPFEKLWEREASGREYELLTGVFGARSRIARLRLGQEEIELTEFLASRGRPMPDDVRANDRVFQHIAIVVSDMARAYQRLRAHGVEHASTGPQRLPDWNPNAGGISAFYFRDPDRHFIEVIHFPRGKGSDRWQGSTGRLFLGIDHTAIVVEDTEASLALYRDSLGLRIAGESENYDVEQEHLNNVFGARLRITTLVAEQGPGIELLEYLAPRDGRPAPTDLRANDIAHWQTTLTARSDLQALMGLARGRRIGLVSPRPVDGAAAGVKQAALARDRDGHGLRFAVQ